MKLLLLCLACLAGAQVTAAKQRASTRRSYEHEEHTNGIETDPRPRTQNFGLPRIPIDAPIGSHDFSHSDPNFEANRKVLEFTQLSSGTDNPKAHNPNIDNPLASVQRILEDGENLVENALHDELGLSMPTKTIEGHDEDYGLEIIRLATAMLKDLIAAPRHQSRLPLGILSSSSSERRRQNDDGSSGNGDSTKVTDVVQVQRSLLELVEQLTKLSLDENVLQDPAFEQLIDRIKLLIVGFRARPILRT